MELEYFSNEFNTIMKKDYATSFARDAALARLMTEMEGTYHIPALNSHEFNEQNPEVMKLYLKISNARKFE